MSGEGTSTEGTVRNCLGLETSQEWALRDLGLEGMYVDCN